jgi:glycosyltransferase involved in cell wall biosynthesis
VALEPASYVKDLGLTILWCLRAGVVFDTMIAAGNLNALAGLALRRIGRVRRLIYYAVDFSERRFEQAAAEWVYRRIDEAALRGADSTWHVSVAMRRAREARFPRAFGSDGSSHLVVPVGVHARRMREAASTVGDARDRVVFVGNILRHHGLGVVLEAVALLRRTHPRVHLDVFGDGPDRMAFEALSQTLGLQSTVTFHGYIVEDTKLEMELGRGGVAVAMYSPSESSFSRYADPGKIKLYLGSGLPVVMTDVPPIARELDGHCAVVIDYSAKTCAKAIQELFTNSQEYLRMRSQAFAIASRLEWETITLGALGHQPETLFPC